MASINKCTSADGLLQYVWRIQHTQCTTWQKAFNNSKLHYHGYVSRTTEQNSRQYVQAITIWRAQLLCTVCSKLSLSIWSQTRCTVATHKSTTRGRSYTCRPEHLTCIRLSINDPRWAPLAPSIKCSRRHARQLADGRPPWLTATIHVQRRRRGVVDVVWLIKASRSIYAWPS